MLVSWKERSEIYAMQVGDERHTYSLSKIKDSGIWVTRHNRRRIEGPEQKA